MPQPSRRLSCTVHTTPSRWRLSIEPLEAVSAVPSDSGIQPDVTLTRQNPKTRHSWPASNSRRRASLCGSLPSTSSNRVVDNSQADANIQCHSCRGGCTGCGAQGHPRRDLRGPRFQRRGEQGPCPRISMHPRGYWSSTTLTHAGRTPSLPGRYQRDGRLVHV
jgi:hypothetical protein